MRAGRRLVKPLYTVQETANSLSYFQDIAYNEVVDLGNGVRVRFQDAGHILGSGIVELWIQDDSEEKKLVFSGDLGQEDFPLVRDRAQIGEGDFVFVESTYGNRNHKGMSETRDEFATAVSESLKRGGNIIIPAFAVGRTQDVLYMLNELSREERLNHLQVFVDSPMAYKATRITLKHPECFDQETLELMKEGHFSRSTHTLKFTESVEESKEINRMRNGAVIVSSSGMCEAGRILHHLKHNLWRPECSIIFVGYQAKGTLGRAIIEGAKKVKIFGEDIAVKARVYTIGGLSAHAGRKELLEWLGRFKKRPKHVFVIHGEEEIALGFAETIKEQLHLTAFVPGILDQVQV
ncbi:MAG: MBL fold metallo-hydrolase [wastewater metagenome]|nr:MBL fold metallo-hydrolase [Candidatus Loosdrechtia aerotolerans]